FLQGLHDRHDQVLIQYPLVDHAIVDHKTHRIFDHQHIVTILNGHRLLAALRNYPKTVMNSFADPALCCSDLAYEGGNTTTRRRPTGSPPGSSRPSCRTAPESPGTCTARPASVRLPTAAAYDPSAAPGSVSPCVPARCAACTGLRQLPPGRWDCR